MTRELAMVGLPLALGGCLSSTTNLGSTFVASANICADGGSLTVQASGVAGTPAAALAGTSITVPAGAIAQCVVIEIGLSNAVVAPAGATADGPVADFTPAPIAFLLPAAIVIPVSPADAGTQLIEAVQPNGSSQTLSVTGVANGLATFQTNVLGLFGGFHPPSGGSSSGGSSSGGSSPACAPADIALSVKTLNFAGCVGSTSPAESLQVENNGCQTSGPISLGVGGANAADFAIATTCDGGLPGNAACRIAVTCTPSINGAETATLTVTASPGTSNTGVTVSLAEVGLCPAQMTVSPASAAFGSSPIGTPTTPVAFTVTNNGGETTGAISTAINGTNAADFVIQPDSTCSGQLTGGKTCELTLIFTPSINGNESATLTISANPGATTPITVPLTGIGTEATLATLVTSYDFGIVDLGQISTAQTFTFTNVGSAATGPLTVAMAGGQAAEFTIDTGAGTTCTPGLTLPPGASCSVSVTFTPGNDLGPASSSLEVSATPGGLVEVALSGTEVTPSQLSCTPASQNFGSIPKGQSSAAVTFTCTSAGGPDAGSLTASIAPGINAGDFAISDESCDDAGVTCQFDVTFTPTTCGQENATLDCTNGTAEATSALAGAAAAVEGPLFVSPDPGTFSSTLIGEDSAAQTFTVANAGCLATGVLNASLGGTGAGEFSILGDGCSGKALGAGNTCSLDIVFTPSVQGTQTANLEVTDGTQAGTATDPLSGSGLLASPDAG